MYVLNVLFMSRVNFEKNQVCAIEESLSLSSVLPRKLCDVTAPYYPISALLSVKWSFMEG